METINFKKETIEASHIFFEKYVASFIQHEDRLVADSLLLKKEHSERVAHLCRFIAEKSLLDKEEQEMAEFIGLWHDLGRFEQYEKYRTFNDDESEDHGELGIRLLQEQEFFKTLPETNQEIILQAIKYHSHAQLPAKLDKQIILFSQILRDADKLDIWETCVKNLQRDGSFKLASINYGLPKSITISEEVIKRISQQKTVLKKDIKSLDDFKLLLISMVFDLNFKCSFLILNEKQLVRKIYDSLPKKDEVYEAYRKVKLFIENKFVV